MTSARFFFIKSEAADEFRHIKQLNACAKARGETHSTFAVNTGPEVLLIGTQ